MIGECLSEGYSIQAHCLRNGKYVDVPLSTPDVGVWYSLDHISYYANDNGDFIPDCISSPLGSHAEARAEAEEHAGKPLTWRPWRPYDYVPEGCAEYAEAERYS